MMLVQWLAASTLASVQPATTAAPEGNWVRVMRHESYLLLANLGKGATSDFLIIQDPWDPAKSRAGAIKGTPDCAAGKIRFAPTDKGPASLVEQLNAAGFQGHLQYAASRWRKVLCERKGNVLGRFARAADLWQLSRSFHYGADERSAARSGTGVFLLVVDQPRWSIVGPLSAGDGDMRMEALAFEPRLPDGAHLRYVLTVDCKARSVRRSEPSVRRDEDDGTLRTLAVPIPSWWQSDTAREDRSALGAACDKREAFGVPRDLSWLKGRWKERLGQAVR